MTKKEDPRVARIEQCFTDEELDAIEARAEAASENSFNHRSDAILALVAEVRRLRGQAQCSHPSLVRRRDGSACPDCKARFFGVFP